MASKDKQIKKMKLWFIIKYYMTITIVTVLKKSAVMALVSIELILLNLWLYKDAILLTI